MANEETQRQALIAGLAISHSDGYFHADEKALFQQLVSRASFLREEYLNLKEMTISLIQEENVTQKTLPLLQQVAETLRPLVQTLASDQPGEHTPVHPLLSGPEYHTAIQICADIATEDFKYIEPYFNDSMTRFHQISQAIQTRLIVWLKRKALSNHLQVSRTMCGKCL